MGQGHTGEPHPASGDERAAHLCTDTRWAGGGGVMEIKAHPFHTWGVGQNGPALTSVLFYCIFLLNYVNLLHSQTQDLNFRKHKPSEPS